MAKKQSISFSGTEGEIVLKQKRASINLKILNLKSKSEELKYQKQLSIINKKLRR